MTQLLLSSQRLEACKVLHTGQLDVLEALQQHSELNLINLGEEGLPSKKILLDWREVQTPITPQSFSDLSGKKLTEYKFQYLGKFSCEEEDIQVEGEKFVARFPTTNISNNTLESTGWTNVTWLLDFLANADKIQADTFRKELLIWKKTATEYTLSLSRETLDKKSVEQEVFAFDHEFKTLTWSHNILFNGE